MQGKMRPLLRLLVKSITGDGERQTDATAARDAHHSASPYCGPLCTERTGHWGRFSELQGFINRHKETDFSIFAATLGRIYFFPFKKLLEMQENPWWETDSNVMAVKQELFYFAGDV